MNLKSSDLKLIQEKSGIRPEDESRLLTFFAELDTPSRIELMKESYKTSRVFSSDSSIPKSAYSILEYAALLKVLHIKKKSQAHETINYNVLGDLKKRKERTQNKLQKQLRAKHFPEIEQLRKAGTSWQLICEYLKKAHGIKVSHTYVIKIFNEEMKNRQI